MTWTRTVPPRLGAAARTFELSDHSGMTQLVVRDEIKGPLGGLIRSGFSSTQRGLDEFVDAVRERSELVG